MFPYFCHHDFKVVSEIAGPHQMSHLEKKPRIFYLHITYFIPKCIAIPFKRFAVYQLTGYESSATKTN